MKNKIWQTIKTKRFLYALLVAVLTLINWLATVRTINEFIQQSWICIVVTFAVLILYLRLALGVGFLMDKHGY